MAQYPALPLFTDAYLADTRHLNAMQHGAYLLLLMTAWRMPDCKLPDDDKFLAKCVAMDARAWKANREVVMSFWERDAQQKWYQARLLDERKYVEDKRNKNASSAKSRWLKNNNSGDTNAYANAMPNGCERNAPTPTPTPTPPLRKEKNIKKKDAVCLPFTSLPVEWMGFCQEEMLWSTEQAESAWKAFYEYSNSPDCKTPKRKDWFTTFKNSCRVGITKPNINLTKRNNDGNNKLRESQEALIRGLTTPAGW